MFITVFLLTYLVLVGDFHIEIFVDRQVDEQSFVEEMVRALHFIIVHGSLVLYALVALSCSEVLHEADLGSLDLPLQSEVSLAVGPPRSPSPRPLLECLHCGRELCPPLAQRSLVPTGECCPRREYVGL